MIGREPGSVEPLDLAKWAREMAAPAEQRRDFKLRDGRTYRPSLDPRVPDGLGLLDARILGLLAGYANRNGEAWPSIKLLAQRSGLKVVEKKRKDGRSAGSTNSAVSAALARLHAAELIWNRGRTVGRKGLRELLFDPSAHAEDNGRNPSATTEVNPANPSASAEGDPSATTEGKEQEEGATSVEGPEQERPEDDLRQGGGRLSPSARIDEDEQDRARLHAALHAAGLTPAESGATA